MTVRADDTTLATRPAAVVQALAQTLPEADAQALARARAFAEPLLAGQTLDTGEPILDHADGVAAIVQRIGGSVAMQAAAYLVYAFDHLHKPHEVIAAAFGDTFADLALETTKLVRVQRQARQALEQQRQRAALPPTLDAQTENVRKMLLAFSRDLRVVLLRLASRLRTLRWLAASRSPLPPGLAAESLQVFAPLANRLGIWEIKWELEDLAFRFLEPQTYHQVARWLDEKRVEREAKLAALKRRLQEGLHALGLAAEVSGRPKHIYSIVKKMRGKHLAFDRVYDVRALRIIVPSVADCYAALDWVHSQFTPLPDEFDDYIARPKVNGYQSLHSVVQCEDGRPCEIQIRTRAMHAHAENGVAAHWAYKEAGARGYAGVSASGAYDAKIAVLRQLLAWERDLASGHTQTLLDDRIYVLTPQASVIELAQGATPVDFAYALHTQLGHRCRGAKVDGVMVALNTALKNGQTVEINAAKEGGPSRDWLNPELGYLASARSRAKVRAWFNAQALAETLARGREAVERCLQREGRSALKLDELASALGYASAEALFEAVGKETCSIKQIEAHLRPTPAQPDEDGALLRKPRSQPQASGLLVVGVDSLLTQMAKCCRPAPPDDIVGFVTRGQGVSVHRADCPNVREMHARHADRQIEVEWGMTRPGDDAAYAVDVTIQADDRTGLLRDISEVFSRERMNVVGVQTQTIRGLAWMTFTVEVDASARLHKVLAAVGEVKGVRWARRR